MQPRALVAAATKIRAQQLAQRLKSLPLLVEQTTAARLSRGDYRLLVCDLARGTEQADRLIAELPAESHVILLGSQLELPLVTRYLQNPRVNHYLGGEDAGHQLGLVVQRLATGAIFGLDWYLPSQATVRYRRLDTFAGRSEAIQELTTFLKAQRLRASLVRTSVTVLEELLMNAMYQAPFEQGRRVFADIEPRHRVRKKTPRPVSLRYAVHDQQVFLCVRDRYGSFQRQDLARSLLRCITSDVQIEEKKLGAGLGLYVIASSVSGLIVNVLPGVAAEFICMLGPRLQKGMLSMLSVATQRPPWQAAEAPRVVEIEAEPLLPTS